MNGVFSRGVRRKQVRWATLPLLPWCLLRLAATAGEGCTSDVWSEAWHRLLQLADHHAAAHFFGGASAAMDGGEASAAAAHPSCSCSAASCSATASSSAAADRSPSLPREALCFVDLCLRP